MGFQKTPFMLKSQCLSQNGHRVVMVDVTRMLMIPDPRQPGQARGSENHYHQSHQLLRGRLVYDGPRGRSGLVDRPGCVRNTTPLKVTNLSAQSDLQGATLNPVPARSAAAGGV